MDYIISSTLSTLAGLCIIIPWLFAGYFIIHIGHDRNTAPTPLRYIVLMVVGGPLTWICILALSLWEALPDEV